MLGLSYVLDNSVVAPGNVEKFGDVGASVGERVLASRWRRRAHWTKLPNQRWEASVYLRRMGRSQAIPPTSRDVRRPLSTSERWYVVRSLPRQEARAEFQLLRQGFPVFFPRTIKTVRHARKLRMVKSSVFPTYMFVVLDIGRDRWRSVNGTGGVASLIMRGETPQPVPVGIVENLLDLVDEEGMVRLDRNLREGQAVRVIAGPFASSIGVLERLNASGRVRVLLNIMNGKVPAHLDRVALEAA
ncbi:MAG: transcription termination/antitermination protein NusG [Methylocystis sp.]